MRLNPLEKLTTHASAPPKPDVSAILFDFLSRCAQGIQECPDRKMLQATGALR